MNTFAKSFVFSLCLSVVSQAQNTTEKTVPKTKPAQARPTINFMGKTFTLQSATTSKIATTNDYYLPNQQRTRFSHRLTIHHYPNTKGAAKQAKDSVDFFNKNGNPSELETAPPEGVTGVYRILNMKSGIQYTIAAYTDAANGNSMIVKEISLRISDKNKKAALDMLKNERINILKKLNSLKFPAIVTTPIAHQPEKAPPLTKLPMLIEKVTDIQDKGRRWIIDDQFAKKNGAKPSGHRPFSVNIVTPKSGKILYLTRPKIADIIRFTLTTDDKKVRESIRFTSLNINKEIPMEKRLMETAIFLERNLAAKFFTAHKGGQIVQRYQTKIGPYSGAVLLGKLNLEGGGFFYIKLVSILSQDNDQGLAAVMLLNPEHYEPKTIKQDLMDGYTQRILHSVRFLKKKAMP